MRSFKCPDLRAARTCLWLGCLFGQVASAAPAAVCTALAVPTDSQEVTCTLDPQRDGRSLRFVATFGGSHDDTKISLDAKLDGAPLACAAGSKTSLFGEDGIVTLDCRFSVVGAAPRTLNVALTVNHAQYVTSSVEDD